MCVVAALRGHRHQRQPGNDGVLDSADVERVVRIVGRDELGGEEPVRHTDRVAAARVHGRVDTCPIGVPVGLGGQQLEPMLLALPRIGQE